MSSVLERYGIRLGVFYQVERPVYGGEAAVPPQQPTSGTMRRGLDAVLAAWQERHGQAVAQD